MVSSSWFKGYDNRINELAPSPTPKSWKINNSEWKVEGENSISLSKTNEWYFFNVKSISAKNNKIEFSNKTDVYVKLIDGEATIQLIGDKEVKIFIAEFKDDGLNSKAIEFPLIVKPGNKINYKL